MPKKATIVVFSGDFDKAYSAFTIAIGAASMGLDVTMYFTFHGLKLVRKGGIEQVSASSPMREKIAAKKRASIEQMVKDAKELGVKFIVCEASMDLMNVNKNDLIAEVDDVVGVGTYVDEAKDSEINLFI